MTTTSAPRRQSGWRILVGVVRILLAAAVLRRLVRTRPGLVDLTGEQPDGHAELIVPGFEPALDFPAGEQPRVLDLPDEPSASGDLTIATESAGFHFSFPGGGAANAVIKAARGFSPALSAAVAVLLVSLGTIVPMIVLGRVTGFVPVFVSIGWLALSGLLVLLAYLGPQGSRNQRQPSAAGPS